MWRFASRPGISNNSIPFWIGGINDATTGNSEGNGLFLNGLPVLMTGDLVPACPGRSTAARSISTTASPP